MEARALRSTAETESVRSSPSAAPPAPYLFADSQPFSYEFDCIATLSGLVDLAAVVLAQARTEKELRAGTHAATLELAEQVTRLRLLQDEIDLLGTRTLLEGRADDKGLQAVANELSKSVADLCADASERLNAELGRLCQQTDASIAASEATARAAVVRFLLGYELAGVSECFEIELKADGYASKLTHKLVGEIEVDYRLHTSRTAFSAPRRLSDLAGPLRLEVGRKRGIFSQSLVGDSRALGRYLVTHLRLEGDVLDLELREKRDAPEALSLQLVRYNDGVTGQVRTSGSEDLFDIPLENSQKLVPVFAALRTACSTPREILSGVTDIRIDGVSAIDEGGSVHLLDRLIQLFEPIVAQLIAHGAATSELSLKRDLGDGRREERFVSLGHLVDKVSALSREDRARLAGLGLDRDYSRSESGTFEPHRP